jgi:hypothetical protein
MSCGRGVMTKSCVSVPRTSVLGETQLDVHSSAVHPKAVPCSHSSFPAQVL